MRSGYVDMHYADTFERSGAEAFSWSWIALDWTPRSLAQYFSLTNTVVEPGYHAMRFAGFSLRCLSTAVEGEERRKPLKQHALTTT